MQIKLKNGPVVEQSVAGVNASERSGSVSDANAIVEADMNGKSLNKLLCTYGEILAGLTKNLPKI